jgi:integrase
LSDLFNYLCEKNAVLDNPTHGVDRPKEGANEGKTPALSDAQAAALLEAPPGNALKAKRDRAILAVLLFHAVRRAELCGLRVKDFSDRKDVKHFRVHSKGGKYGKVVVMKRSSSKTLQMQVAVLRELSIITGSQGSEDPRPLAETESWQCVAVGPSPAPVFSSPSWPRLIGEWFSDFRGRGKEQSLRWGHLLPAKWCRETPQRVPCSAHEE